MLSALESGNVWPVMSIGEQEYILAPKEEIEQSQGHIATPSSPVFVGHVPHDNRPFRGTRLPDTNEQVVGLGNLVDVQGRGNDPLVT